MDGGLRAPGACLPEGELVCPCVKEEEALASPLLPGNDPEQGTKGFLQGWDLFSVWVHIGHPESTRRAALGKAAPGSPRIAMVPGAGAAAALSEN